jgi:hypothetical protein
VVRVPVVEWYEVAILAVYVYAAALLRLLLVDEIGQVEGNQYNRSLLLVPSRLMMMKGSYLGGVFQRMGLHIPQVVVFEFGIGTIEIMVVMNRTMVEVE